MNPKSKYVKKFIFIRADFGLFLSDFQREHDLIGEIHKGESRIMTFQNRNNDFFMPIIAKDNPQLLEFVFKESSSEEEKYDSLARYNGIIFPEVRGTEDISKRLQGKIKEESFMKMIEVIERNGLPKGIAYVNGRTGISICHYSAGENILSDKYFRRREILHKIPPRMSPYSGKEIILPKQCLEASLTC